MNTTPTSMTRVDDDAPLFPGAGGDPLSDWASTAPHVPHRDHGMGVDRLTGLMRAVSDSIDLTADGDFSAELDTYALLAAERGRRLAQDDLLALADAVGVLTH